MFIECMDKPKNRALSARKTHEFQKIVPIRILEDISSRRPTKIFKHLLIAAGTEPLRKIIIFHERALSSGIQVNVEQYKESEDQRSLIDRKRQVVTEDERIETLY